MKKNKKLIPLTVALLSTLTGCTGRVETLGDPTKINLIVEYYDGGYGSQYIRNAAARFEEMYKDYEKGDLKGVKISFVPSSIIGTDVFSKYGDLSSDIFFTEAVTNYYDLANSGKLLDISDILNENIASQGHSIIDAMNETYKDYLGIDKDGGKHYYAIPAGTTFMGLTFDETLFYNMGYMLTADSDEKTTGSVNSYIDPTNTPFADGSFAERVTDDNGATYYYKTVEDDGGVRHKLSAGPDGVFGTSDDGMAATYDSFFQLCEKMKKTVKPFIFYSKKSDYQFRFLNQLMCDFEGPEEAMKFWSFTGTKNNLVSVDESGNFTNLPGVELNPNGSNDNASVYKSKGNYYAYDFARKMWNNYVSDFCKGNHDQFEAQEEFMRSLPRVDGGEKTGFLIDGDWWQNESKEKGKFDAIENDSGEEYSFNNRRFKTYALPKATADKVGEKRTILDDGYRQAFILKKVEQDSSKLEIAKKFLQYCFLDEQNVEYTALTGSVRPMDYTMPEAEENKMTYFAKSVYNTVRESNVITPISNNAYYRYNSKQLEAQSMQLTKINGLEYTSLRQISTTFTTKQAFDGCYTYHAAKLSY